MCHSLDLKIRGQLSGIFSLHPSFQDLSVYYQAHVERALPTGHLTASTLLDFILFYFSLVFYKILPLPSKLL